MKKRLMIFCDSYLPGHRGGGGMWSVKNLAERFCDRYDFFIVTRDCDGKMDGTPYVKIARDKWTKRSEASVYYASPSNLNSRTFADLVTEVKPDAVYLNSVFSKVCVTYLFARKRFSNRDLPVVLAPCGEFSDAAINIKRLRKHAFFRIGKRFGLFRNITWKATSDTELAEISRFVSDGSKIRVAPELTPRDILPDFKTEDKPRKRAKSVRLVYLSRITPKKNLHFLLELLRELEGAIELKVIGATDDTQYFEKCKRIASTLPENVVVELTGSVDYEAALNIAKRSHFMVLPTKNENFGYVVIESLAAGCPVILSDQIEWRGIQENNAGWKIPLDDRDAWLSKLNTCILMGSEEYSSMSFSAREFAVRYLIADEQTAVNRMMFDSVLAA